jgi:hypothetical protein
MESGAVYVEASIVLGVLFLATLSVGTLSQAALKQIQFRNALQNTAWSLSSLDSNSDCAVHATSILTNELQKFGMVLSSSTLTEDTSVVTANRRIKLSATTAPVLTFTSGINGDLSLMLEDGTSCTGL